MGKYIGRKTGYEQKFVVVDEVSMEEVTKEGIYKRVIQVLDWEDGIKRIRFGYYVKDSPNDKWKWGSQTTYTAPLEFTKKLILKAQDKGLL